MVLYALLVAVKLIFVFSGDRGIGFYLFIYYSKRFQAYREGAYNHHNKKNRKKKTKNETNSASQKMKNLTDQHLRNNTEDSILTVKLNKNFYVCNPSTQEFVKVL
jgi:sortase (surface protein transpeptidase)